MATSEHALTDNHALPLERIERAEEIVMSKRDELLRNIDRVDEELATIADGAARVPLEREASRLKARAADLLLGREELRGWRTAADGDAYRGLPTSRGDGGGDREREIRQRSTREAERIATEVGFDGRTVAGRYASDTAPSRALVDHWQRDEFEAFRRSRPIGFADNPERQEEAAIVAYTSVHRRIASQFMAARNELAELERNRARVREQAARGELHRASADEARAFTDAVRSVLSDREVRLLERGDPAGITSVSNDERKRLALARTFLDAEARTVPEARREALQRTVERIDQMDEALRRSQSGVESTERDQPEEGSGRQREDRNRARDRSDRGLDL